MADDLSGFLDAEIESRLEEMRTRMRPVEQQLTELRAERDVLLTERRRRERAAHRERRANVKEAMKTGALPTFAEFIESAEAGGWGDFPVNLQTRGGGGARLPRARPPGGGAGGPPAGASRGPRG